VALENLTSGRNIPTMVMISLVSTVLFRPMRFIRLLKGMARKKNQINTNDGTKPVIVDDHPKENCI
jgi:hypothetical protein